MCQILSKSPPSWLSQKVWFWPHYRIAISVCAPNLAKIQNTFIGDRYMAEEQNPRWRRPPSWISNKCYSGLVWPIWSGRPNLVQISQEVASIHLFVYFQDGGRLGFVVLQFCITHEVPLDGLYLLCQWLNDPVWCNVTETLRFYVFGDLAGKCLLAPLWGSFWAITVDEWSDVDPQRTRCHFSGFYLRATFRKNRSRNATVRVRTDRRTDARTDRRTQKRCHNLPYAML